MKRLVIAWLAILSLASASLAYADPAPVSPSCADITGGGFSLVNGVVGGSIDTLEPSCQTVTYTLNVIYTNGSGNKQQMKSDSVQGNDTTVVQLSVRVPGRVTVVDTFVTSTDASGVLDRGPDEGTIEVSEGSGGGSGYN